MLNNDDNEYDDNEIDNNSALESYINPDGGF